MLGYRIRAIILAGVVCAFTVWVVPVRSQEDEVVEEAAVEEVQPAAPADPKAAITTKDPNITADELKLRVKPLTLEELQNEAAAWMILLQAKATEISEAEIAIQRQNLAINKQKEAANALDTAKKALQEAEKIQSSAAPGSPEYQEATKKVEEAKENLKKAQEAVDQVKTTKEELKEDETSQSALKKGQITGDLEKAKQIVDETKKSREQMVAGSLEYDDATQKIEKLEAAIKVLEDAQEAQKSTQPDTPEYEKATQEIDKADKALKQVIREIGGSDATKPASEQSSESLNQATASLGGTEINGNREEKVAGPPEVADSQQNLEQKQQQLEQTTEQLQKSAEKESEAKNQLVVTVTELQLQQTGIIDRFNVVLNELDKKGGDSKSYRSYITAVSGIELDVKDTEGLGLRLVSWLKSDEGGMRWGTNIGKFAGVFVVSIIVAQILGFIVNRVLLLFGGVSEIFRQFIVLIIKRGGIVVGFLLALTALEVTLGPILALVGGVSFVLAFAFQENLGNLASGLMIMVYKPFDVGDEIKVNEIWGWVETITLANTQIKGLDQQLFILPNNTVWSSMIENLTQDKVREFSVTLRIGFDENLTKINQLLIDTAKSHPKVLEKPEPSVFLWEIEEYYIRIELEGFTNKEDFWTVHSDMILLIKERFDKEGIKLAAIPIQDIRLKQVSNGKMPQLVSETSGTHIETIVSETSGADKEEMQADVLAKID